MRGTINSVGIVTLITLALPAGVQAQEAGGRGDGDEARNPGSILGEFFVYGDLAVPVGEFQSHVHLGGGGGMGGLLYLNRERNAALRLEGTGVVYGSQTVTTPLSLTVPFVDVDVTTTNYIMSAGAGPQVFLRSGSVRPYIFGTVGFSYFATETSVSGISDDYDFASTVNFDDFTLALTGGGGLSVQLYRGEATVSLDLSVSYRHNGLTEYLTKGDLRKLPRGGWAASPVLSDANLVTYRVGVSLGIPRKPER